MRSDPRGSERTHSSTFAALGPAELHAILALRVRVFVVEQRCAFQEIDGLDPLARHWWSTGEHDEVVAYLRVLDEGSGTQRIGRVVTAPEHRGTGAGAALMRAALEAAVGPVVLGAQVRVRGFYERLGFAVDGPEYDEDGIAHVPMRRPGGSATATPRPVPPPRITGASQRDRGAWGSWRSS